MLSLSRIDDDRTGRERGFGVFLQSKSESDGEVFCAYLDSDGGMCDIYSFIHLSVFVLCIYLECF